MKLIRKHFKYAQEIAKLPFGEHSDSNTRGYSYSSDPRVGTLGHISIELTESKKDGR